MELDTLAKVLNNGPKLFWRFQSKERKGRTMVVLG